MVCLCLHSRSCEAKGRKCLSPCFFALLSLCVAFDVASASALHLQGGSISNTFMLARKNWVYIVCMFKQQLSSGAFLRLVGSKIITMCWMEPDRCVSVIVWKPLFFLFFWEIENFPLLHRQLRFFFFFLLYIFYMIKEGQKECLIFSYRLLKTTKPWTEFT